MEREKSGREEDALVKKKGELNAEGEDVTSGEEQLGIGGPRTFTEFCNYTDEEDEYSAKIETRNTPFLSFLFPSLEP